MVESKGNAISTTPAVTSRHRRALFAGTVGNLVEWFDWSVYAFFVPYFAAAFFPAGDRFAQVLSGFLVFAIGFFMRPLGGALLGSYSDRHGRRAGMTLGIGLMAGASLAIAVLPGYGQIGILAPVLLTLARCVQGISAGGEFGASSAFLVENAPPGRRAWAGSFQQVSVGAGTLLASILAAFMFATLPEADLAAWGWRVAFGVGAVMGLLGLWLRLAVPDTEIFTRTRDEGRLASRPLTQVLREHPRAALRVVGMVAAGTALVQFWFVSLPSLVNLKTGVELADAQLAAMLGLALFTILQPVSGWLSDRFGRRPLLLAFALGSAVSFVPTLATIGTTMSSVLVAVAVNAIFLAAYAGSLAAVMAEQFPAAVRTAGISLPYGIAVAVFGGLAPVLATATLRAEVFWVFEAVMVALCLVSAVVFWRMPETSDRGRPASAPSP
ncbi:MFS transporter [Propioniciclava coleopterorum]|uniref:MFS transporter n=1 Tax=Propioniciclava coleopterorum TaxID=2714937 RepID=A0A6G7Y4P5_9ACTN|nr:MFS transporter [Propioniciclava coleopterorum]QIK71636.1 MFS transporter [Propioniciclava coleopterorum]